MKRNVRKGFTLIEVIMVVAIIAIIAAFVVPNIAGKMNKAKKNLAKAGISKLQTSLVEFQSDCNRYPYDDEGLESLLDYPDDLEEIWDGPYAKEKNLIDPWGNDFIFYEDEETEDGYVIVSMGPNGQEDDSEEGDDIISD